MVTMRMEQTDLATNFRTFGVGGVMSYNRDGSAPAFFTPSLADGAANSPSQMIVAGDAAPSGVILFPNNFQTVVATRTSDIFRSLHWHLTGANTLFCDTHIEFMKDADLYSATDA